MRLLALALIFAANATFADVPTSAAPASTKAPEAPALSIWKPVDGGGYEHLQTGLLCPARIDGYRRTETVSFDDFGLDVGCNYTSENVGVTFYLTRREGPGREPLALPTAMAEAKRELLQGGAERHAQFLSETTAREGDLDWTVALFGEDSGLHSAIWISDLSGWVFEFRATYPAAEEARVVADIKSIAASIRATAGARLQLCAKTPQPERKGKAVTDPAQIQSAAMMSSILGGAIQAAVQDHKNDKAAKDEPLEAPVVWCVDRAAVVGDYAMLFWRGVRSDATDAPDDQATLVTRDAPLALSVSAGGMDGLVEAANKKAGEPEQWTASVQRGDQTLIFGYFAGRPSADLVLDLFGRIVTGKQKPVGGYSAKGRTITIVAPGK